MTSSWACRIRVGSVVLLVLLAGCGEIGSFINGNKSMSFSSDPVHVSEDAVSESGFSVTSDEGVSFEHTIEVQGQSRRIDMGAHMVHLERSYEGAPLASVVLLSVPQVKIVGQQVDVVKRIGPTSLVGDARSSADDLEQGQKVESHTVRILGTDRSVEVFSGSASQEGQSTDVRIYVTTFNHGGDTIVGVGVVPKDVSEDRDGVLTLLEGIER